jgi:hypothetical protein
MLQRIVPSIARSSFSPGQSLIPGKEPFRILQQDDVLGGKGPQRPTRPIQKC